MVESDLLSLYQYMNQMKHFGGYSLEELENLYPFERTIFYGLLTKTLEEQNKNR